MESNRVVFAYLNIIEVELKAVVGSQYEGNINSGVVVASLAQIEFSESPFKILFLHKTNGICKKPNEHECLCIYIFLEPCI